MAHVASAAPRTSRVADHLTPDRLSVVLTDVCRRVGLDADGARLIKFTNSAVFELRCAPVVVRIAGSQTMRDRVGKVISVARWLAEHDIPAVRLWGDVPQPIQVGKHVATLWYRIPATGAAPTGADLGQILRQYHSLPATTVSLPPWQPLSICDSEAHPKRTLPGKSCVPMSRLASGLATLSAPLGQDLASRQSSQSVGDRNSSSSPTSGVRNIDVHYLITTETSADVAQRAPRVAILPVGSFEQHGAHLPLITDTVVALAIAKSVADAYPVLLLPPITILCSHEHAAWPGTVSITSQTLQCLVRDVAASLEQSGIRKLVIVNGHGGNYVLANVVQEANVVERRMSLFPTREDWQRARQTAQLGTTSHEDMHAGELETSILMHVWPSLIRPGNETADHLSNDRGMLLVHGMQKYTDTGVIGRPSLGSAEKGKAVLESLVESFHVHIRAVEGDT